MSSTVPNNTTPPNAVTTGLSSVAHPSGIAALSTVLGLVLPQLYTVISQVPQTHGAWGWIGLVIACAGNLYGALAPKAAT